VILAITVAALIGALLGAGSGWLGVQLERVEKLESEEAEERLQYERDVAEASEAAAREGKPAPKAEPWVGEQYGWSWREYALSPALMAGGYAGFVAHEGVGAGLFIHLLWVTVLVHILVFDLKHRLILNKITYPSILIAVALAQVSPGLTVTRALIGGAGVALFFFMLNLISRGGIGLGDAKLGALIGAITGAGNDPAHLGAVYASIYGILLGGAAAVLLLITRLRRLRDPIPYGPFLCAGAAIILYQGP
jgi:prepilin signal peptidase PulO-like enzyme (type II secretory pathway)